MTEKLAFFCHKVCVALNIALSIKPRYNDLQESVDLIVGASCAELSYPDVLARLVMRTHNILLKIVDIRC
jgi:hypothetical protein